MHTMTRIRTEYLAVTRSGFVLQIDAPDLAMERVPKRPLRNQELASAFPQRGVACAAPTQRTQRRNMEVRLPHRWSKQDSNCRSHKKAMAI
jgi:hypothetical protein